MDGHVMRGCRGPLLVGRCRRRERRQEWRNSGCRKRYCSSSRRKRAVNTTSTKCRLADGQAHESESEKLTTRRTVRTSKLEKDHNATESRTTATLGGGDDGGTQIDIPDQPSYQHLDATSGPMTLMAQAQQPPVAQSPIIHADRRPGDDGIAGWIPRRNGAMWEESSGADDDPFFTAAETS
ncbi:hypothetical protein BC567DRAFT_71542 [Phyllosticta citribraziliensis]